MRKYQHAAFAQYAQVVFVRLTRALVILIAWPQLLRNVQALREQLQALVVALSCDRKLFSI